MFVTQVAWKQGLNVAMVGTNEKLTTPSNSCNLHKGTFNLLLKRFGVKNLNKL